MCYSVIQDVFQIRQRKRSATQWAKRIVGLIIVLTGSTLLATDLLHAASATPRVPSITTPTSVAP